MNWRALNIAAFMIVAPLTVQAQTARYIHADGPQVPTLSLGDGTFTVEFTTVTDFKLEGSFRRLQGTPTAIKIKEGVMGAPSGATLHTVNLLDPTVQLSDHGGRVVKYCGSLSMMDADTLKSNMAHIMIESSLFPAGEIRGQIYFGGVPALPGGWILPLVLVCLGSGVFLVRRRLGS